jgi:hypothetical protein
LRSLKSVQLFSLALFVAGLANASRLETDDSTYGSSPLTSESFTCLGASGTPATPSSPPCGSGAALLEQTFVPSSRPGTVLFDFNIIENTPNISNFTLTLTGHDATGDVAAFVPDITPQQWGYGALKCGNTATGEQCGPDPGGTVPPVTFSTDISGAQTVMFMGQGDGNGFVFFGVVPEGSGVSANLELVSTPEPGSWLLLASGILVLMALRGRLMKLLKPSCFSCD